MGQFLMEKPGLPGSALSGNQQSNNTLRTSLATYDAAGAVITASSTSFNAALDAYRNGVGAITEVNVAQSQLLQAKIISIDAHSAALSAAAGLALATGALGAAPE